MLFNIIGIFLHKSWWIVKGFLHFFKSVLIDKLNKNKVVFDEKLVRSYDYELSKFKIIIDDLQEKLIVESKK